MIKFVPSLEKGVSDILQRVVTRLQNSGKLIQTALRTTVQRHFQTIYPGSNHYNPNKVTDKSFTNGNTPSGQINIDVPGITRAYRDLHIRPIHSKHLTIPMHTSAYGKKAREFNDLIYIKKKNGRRFLVQKNGSNLVFMYFLANKVDQPRDPRLMPTDNTLTDNICGRLIAYLKNTK